MDDIAKNTGNNNKLSKKSDLPEKPATTSALKAKKRKKTERSGNAFKRVPKQYLLKSTFTEPIVLHFN